MSRDPLWDEYTESLAGLGKLPDKLSTLREHARDDKDHAIEIARTQREYELQRAREWGAQSRRAIANAEARLVAAKLLIPDPVHTSQVQNTDPEFLAEELNSSVRSFHTQLSLLDATRKRARNVMNTVRSERRRREYMKRRMIVAGAALSVLFLLVILAYAV